MIQNGLPNHRDLWVLVIGLTIGLMLSEWGLGQIAPDQYEQWFNGSQKILRKLDNLDFERDKRIDQMRAELAEKAARLKGTGSDTALENLEFEKIRQQNAIAIEYLPQREKLKDLYRKTRDEYAKQHQNWLVGLILVLVATMIYETLLDPSSKSRNNMIRSRLTTIRYALIAGWLAIYLAQPSVFFTIPMVFVILLLVAVMGAALVPLGPSKPKSLSDKNQNAPSHDANSKRDSQQDSKQDSE